MYQTFKMNARALYNYVRFIKNKVKKNVVIRGRQFLSIGSKFIIESGSSVRIDPYMRIENGSYIAVRSTGSLIVGRNVFMNRNCMLVCREKIQTDDNVTIGPNCCIYDHDHDLNLRLTGKYTTSPVAIGENTWIGAGCIILKGVTIGRNCVIAAGGVITKDVPDNTIAYQKRDTSYVKNASTC